MNILLVGHEKEFAAVLAAGLREVGYSVESASSAEEALDRIAKRDVSLALVEYATGGRAFLRKYHEIDPNLTVVVLTGLPSHASAVEFLKGGADALAVDYIIKPEPDLIARLQDIIEERFTRIRRGKWLIDRRSRRIYFDGKDIEMSDLQFELMVLFLRNPYKVIDYPTLALAAQGRKLDRATALKSMKGNISRIRDLLAIVTGRDRNDILRTVDGDGLMFVPGSRQQEEALV